MRIRRRQVAERAIAWSYPIEIAAYADAGRRLGPGLLERHHVPSSCRGAVGEISVAADEALAPRARAFGAA